MAARSGRLGPAPLPALLRSSPRIAGDRDRTLDAARGSGGAREAVRAAAATPRALVGALARSQTRSEPGEARDAPPQRARRSDPPGPSSSAPPSAPLAPGRSLSAPALPLPDSSSSPPSLRVALVGRPNVGKSSLLNRLCRSAAALVSDLPGTTRDRVEASADWRGWRVEMADTGGMLEEGVELPGAINGGIPAERADAAARRRRADAHRRPSPSSSSSPAPAPAAFAASLTALPSFAPPSPSGHLSFSSSEAAAPAARRALDRAIRAQAEAAIEAADVVVLVADARVGATRGDADALAWVRRVRPGAPVVLAANKAEGGAGGRGSAFGADLWELGLEPVPVSAATGSGTGDLLDAVLRAAGRLRPEGGAAPPSPRDALDQQRAVRRLRREARRAAREAVLLQAADERKRRREERRGKRSRRDDEGEEGNGGGENDSGEEGNGGGENDSGEEGNGGGENDSEEEENDEDESGRVVGRRKGERASAAPALRSSPLALPPPGPSPPSAFPLSLALPLASPSSPSPPSPLLLDGSVASPAAMTSSLRRVAELAAERARKGEAPRGGQPRGGDGATAVAAQPRGGDGATAVAAQPRGGDGATAVAARQQLAGRGPCTPPPGDREPSAERLAVLGPSSLGSSSSPSPPPPVRIALLGRPNAGKSSLLNRLVGAPRSIVSSAPGTTRDAVDARVALPGGGEAVLVDTAGLRRRSAVAASPDLAERLGAAAALRALRRADVAVLVIDASQGVAGQDAALAALADEAGVGVVVAVTKCDLVGQGEGGGAAGPDGGSGLPAPDRDLRGHRDRDPSRTPPAPNDQGGRQDADRDQGGRQDADRDHDVSRAPPPLSSAPAAGRRAAPLRIPGLLAPPGARGALAAPPQTRAALELALRRALRPADYANVVFCSARTGKNVRRVLEAARDAHAARARRVPTATVTRALFEALRSRPTPPAARGRPAKLRYATQVSVAPPTIAVFGSRNAGTLPESYRTSLRNAFRKIFGFPGSPLRLVFRSAEEESGGRGARTAKRDDRIRNGAPRKKTMTDRLVRSSVYGSGRGKGTPNGAREGAERGRAAAASRDRERGRAPEAARPRASSPAPRSAFHPSGGKARVWRGVASAAAGAAGRARARAPERAHPGRHGAERLGRSGTRRVLAKGKAKAKRRARRRA